MTQPLVEFSPDPWRLRQPEVRLPSPNIGPQTIHHILHTAPATAAGQLPDVLLERHQRLDGDLSFDYSPRGDTKTVAQELATEHTGHCAFVLVERQAQLAVEPPKQRHHPLTCPAAADVNVRIVGVAHEAIAPAFKHLVH